MRDAGTQLRKSYADALTGQITVSGDVIPVYYGKVESSVNVPLYILINEHSDQDKSSKSHFAVESTLTIDIYEKKPSAVSLEKVESIADQMLQIIKPTPKTIGVTIAAPFKILIVKVENNDSNRPLQIDNQKFVVSKSLRFRNHITQ